MCQVSDTACNTPRVQAAFGVRADGNNVLCAAAPLMEWNRTSHVSREKYFTQHRNGSMAVMMCVGAMRMAPPDSVVECSTSQAAQDPRHQ